MASSPKKSLTEFVPGFIHEAQRPDRDKYVDILWKNIDPSKYCDFEKIDIDLYGQKDFPYDLCSATARSRYYGSKVSSN